MHGLEGLQTEERKITLRRLKDEAISRLFESGLSVPEVALMSGHKTLAALQIYANMRPEAVGMKLRKLGARGREQIRSYNRQNPH